MPHHFVQSPLGSNKARYINQLSILELSLLVACKRTAELHHDDEGFNFEMILVGKRLILRSIRFRVLLVEYNKFVSHRTYGKEYLITRPVVLKVRQSVGGVLYI